LTEGHISGRANVGHALETVVLNELERRKAELGYVKTAGGFEVDFHARFLAGGGELVQVCAAPSVENTMDRELRALSEAAREYPRAKRHLLVLTQDQVFPIRAPGVQVQPAYEWLLSTPV
jgi:predicted AAA+ superfamily ATPase